MTPNSAASLLQKLLLWLPLGALPWMLNLRWMALNEPNEPPKWAVLTLTGLVIAMAFALYRYLTCRFHGTQTPTADWPAWGLRLFIMGVGVSAITASNPGAGLNRWAFWCSAALVAAAVAHSSRQQSPQLHKALQWTLTLSLAVLSLFFWESFFVDFKQPGFNAFVLFSRIGHFNYTADALVWAIPLLVWTLLSGRELFLKILAALTLASCLFMLVTSGSLGGMGGLLAGGVLTAAVWFASRFRLSGSQRHGEKPVRLRPLGYAAAMILALGLAGKSLYPHIPQTYRDLMLTRAEWWSAPQANAMENARHLPPLTPFWLAITPYLGARTPMWAATAGMVGERPWLGFGTGSYVFEYPAFEKRYDLFQDPEVLGNQIRTDPHNVLLWIAAENGLPMMLLFGGLYAWLTIRVTLQAWRTPHVFWLCGAWALWAAGLDAQVNQVFFSPVSLFLTALGVGLWYGALPQTPPSGSRLGCVVWGNPLAPVLIFVGAIWLASYPLTSLVSSYYVSEARRLEAAQPTVSYRQILLAWVNARRWSPTNAEALYGLANAAFRQKHFASAESYLTAFLRLAPNHTPGLNLMANIQMENKQFDAAEKTLEHAIALEPDAALLKDNLETLRKNRDSGQGSEAGGTPPPATLPSP